MNTIELVQLLRDCAKTLRLMDDALEHANIDTPIDAYPLLLENRCERLADKLEKDK
jgi:hypothetical protein